MTQHPALTYWKASRVKGFLTVCPYCEKQTQIEAKRITDNTTVFEFPNWERGNCQHCGKPIIIHMDVTVIATNKDQ